VRENASRRELGRAHHDIVYQVNATEGC